MYVNIDGKMNIKENKFWNSIIKRHLFKNNIIYELKKNHSKGCDNIYTKLETKIKTEEIL